MSATGLRLVFRSDRRVELEEYEAPETGPGQILVRVARSQVSAGTELNFFREHPPAGPRARSSAT